MYHNLEYAIEGKKMPIVKSKGERRIADFFDNNSIKYQYEPGVLINSAENKTRIWYLDFYLPEFGVYAEYYGMAGDKNYNQGIKVKETAYSKNGLEVIPVYPWMFSEDWQGYIMRELKRTVKRRYRNLKAKPYWSRPIAPKHNNPSFPRRSHNQGFYKNY